MSIMHREGHIGLGLVLFAPVAFVLTYYDMLTVMAYGLVCATVFSYAPDFDLWLPYVSHRGATHTVLGGLVSSLLAAIIGLVLAIRGVVAVQLTPVSLLEVASSSIFG